MQSRSLEETSIQRDRALRENGRHRRFLSTIFSDWQVTLWTSFQRTRCFMGLEECEESGLPEVLDQTGLAD